MVYMNSRMLLLLLIIAFNINARVYGLKDLYKNAILNSKRLQSIEIELRKADAEVQDVIGTSMPQISTSLALSHTSIHQENDQEKLGSVIDELLDDPEVSDDYETGLTLFKSAALTDQMMRLPKDTVELSLNLKQAIFAQGKIRLGIKIAKIRQRAIVCKYNLEKMKIKSEIANSYYSAILALEKVKISSEAVSLAEQTHRLAVITHLVGRSGELDTLNSLLRLEKAKIALQRAQSAQKMAYETIKSQSGIDDEPSDFSIEGSLDETVFSMQIEQVLEKVHSDNPNIARLKGNREIHDHLVRIARNDFYPTIHAGASLSGMGMFDDYDNMKKPVFANEKKIYMILKWDIFTGVSKIQRLHKAEADRTISLLSEQQIIREFDLQAKKAYEQVLLSRDNLMSSKSLIRLAEKSHLIAKKAYEVGSKTFLDVQNAEFELNNAKILLCEALFSYQSAIINLKLLMGNI